MATAHGLTPHLSIHPYTFGVEHIPDQAPKMARFMPGTPTQVHQNPAIHDQEGANQQLGSLPHFDPTKLSKHTMLKDSQFFLLFMIEPLKTYSVPLPAKP